MPDEAHTSGDAPKRWRRLKARYIFLIGLGLLLLLFCVWRAGIAWRLDAEIEAMRAAGYPMSLAALDRRDDDPPAEAKRGAELYRKAFGKIVSQDTKRVPIVTKGFVWPKSRHTHPPMPEKILTATNRYLEANAEVLKLIHEAGGYDRPRFRRSIPHDPMRVYGRGASFTISDHSSCRKASYLLVLEAMIHAERGEAKPVIQAVEDVWALADALQREPFMSEHMVAWSIREYALRYVVERILNRMALSDEKLKSLAAATPSPDHTENFRRMVVAEWAYSVESMNAVSVDWMDQVYAATLGESEHLGWLNEFYVVSGLSQLDQLLCVSAYRRVLVLADEPSPKRLRGLKRLEEGLDDSSALWTQWFCDWANTLCRVAPRAAETVASIRTAHTAIAVERY